MFLLCVYLRSTQYQYFFTAYIFSSFPRIRETEHERTGERTYEITSVDRTNLFKIPFQVYLYLKILISLVHCILNRLRSQTSVFEYSLNLCRLRRKDRPYTFFELHTPKGCKKMFLYLLLHNSSVNSVN